MTSVLPHSAVMRANVSRYVREVADHVNGQVADLEKSGAYRSIYKTTLAADCFLEKLPKSSCPQPNVLRGIIQRVPVLIAMGQYVPASIELRRFLECVFWCVYFTDHQIEWVEFKTNPERAIERDVAQPIKYNAHREPAFYRNYARERMSEEPSGLAKRSVEYASGHYSNLSAAAHGSSSIQHARLAPPLYAVDESEIGKFARTFRSVASGGAIILAAFFRKQFDSLPPAHREWFDWLIGSDRKKKIRSGPFGLNR